MPTESKKLQTIEGFTPGPWSVIGLNSHGMTAVVQGTDGKGKHLAACSENSTEERRTQRLMAYAPDLYRIAHEQREVIRKAVEAMGAILQPGGCDWQAIREALAAAAPFLED